MRWVRLVAWVLGLYAFAVLCGHFPRQGGTGLSWAASCWWALLAVPASVFGWSTQEYRRR